MNITMKKLLLSMALTFVSVASVGQEKPVAQSDCDKTWGTCICFSANDPWGGPYQKCYNNTEECSENQNNASDGLARITSECAAMTDAKTESACEAVGICAR